MLMNMHFVNLFGLLVYFIYVCKLNVKSQTVLFKHYFNVEFQLKILKANQNTTKLKGFDKSKFYMNGILCKSLFTTLFIQHMQMAAHTHLSV